MNASQRRVVLRRNKRMFPRECTVEWRSGRYYYWPCRVINHLYGRIKIEHTYSVPGGKTQTSRYLVVGHQLTRRALS